MITPPNKSYEKNNKINKEFLKEIIDGFYVLRGWYPTFECWLLVQAIGVPSAFWFL